jgi:isopenicillin N synthase-like dioxygenase
VPTLPPSTLGYELVVSGSDYISVPDATVAAMAALVAEARRFFAAPTEHKARFEAAKTGTMTGWRRIGVEYSQTPDRPDLNETFCYRHRDDAAPTVPEHSLRAACRNAQRVLDAAAAAALTSLAEVAGRTHDVEPIRTFEESWLQLNWSRPSTASREFIQDAHEDGHLLTLLVADAPGLEILDPKQGWVEVWPTIDRILVFAGECSALLVDGRVVPMMHRVRARAEVTTRLSVAYFVNPDLDQTLEPWIPGARNQGIDLLRWGQLNPARFGLPAL